MIRDISRRLGSFKVTPFRLWASWCSRVQPTRPTPARGRNFTKHQRTTQTECLNVLAQTRVSVSKTSCGVSEKWQKRSKKLCSWRCGCVQMSEKPLPIKADSLKKTKLDAETDPGWSLFQGLTVPPSVGRTPDARKQGRNFCSSSGRTAEMQCGISTVQNCFQPPGCSKTTLCNHSKLSEKDTRLPSPVSQQWQLHTPERPPLPQPRCGTRRRSSMPVRATMHDKRHVFPKSDQC